MQLLKYETNDCSLCSINLDLVYFFESLDNEYCIRFYTISSNPDIIIRQGDKPTEVRESEFDRIFDILFNPK